MHQAMETILGRTAALVPTDAAHRARIDRLVRSHFALVWRYLRRLGLTDADADDAAQQVFLTTSRKLDRVDPASERAYLLGVALRVAADFRKARRRQRTESDQALEHARDPAPNPEQALEQHRACELLDRLLDALDQETRAVLVLYEIEELTMQEIASALGVPMGTVASRLRRGRAKFQAGLQRHRQQEGDLSP
jgi:RNA polymerase sigma-70 factor (ECF subfamily)